MGHNTVAFIGLGRMGYRMAANLRAKLESSWTLIVNDLDKKVCEDFVRENESHGPIQVAASAKEAVSAALIVVSIVTASPHVRSVYLDHTTGAISATPNDRRIFLECSTIDLHTTREVQEKLTAANLGTYVDTPVSGGVEGAREGTLSFLVGHPEGDDETGRRIKDIVLKMGHQDRIVFCGGFSKGLAAKIANNYVACNNMLILSEAFAMGLANGVDRKVLFECMRNSSGASWSLEHAQPVPGIVPGPASNNYEVSFLMPMIIKDVRLGLEMAEGVNVPTPVGQASMRVFKGADADPRCANRDCTSVWLHVSDCRFDPEFNAKEG